MSSPIVGGHDQVYRGVPARVQLLVGDHPDAADHLLHAGVIVWRQSRRAQRLVLEGQASSVFAVAPIARIKAT